jgi:hypothetical protein
MDRFRIRVIAGPCHFPKNLHALMGHFDSGDLEGLLETSQSLLQFFGVHGVRFQNTNRS